MHEANDIHNNEYPQEMKAIRKAEGNDKINRNVIFLDKSIQIIR